MSGVRADGKFFRVGDDRFNFRGVTYGTFRPREPDGARFPPRARIKQDLADMSASGFTVVRTYTAPPDDLLDIAADYGLKVLAGVFYPDWRYLVGLSRRQRRRVAANARREVREVAFRLAGNDDVLGLTLGNEVPADVLRWLGTKTVAGTIAHLVDVVKDIDPDRLVTYANYPTAEYLPLESLDFLTFNVFLERQPDFRRYLTRLHHLAGDRPLVLGELGLDARDGSPEGADHQAQVLDWQLETALERGVAGACVFSWTDEWWVGDAAVEGWHFGLTREDRTARPALDVAEWWNRRTVADLEKDWPSISVVVCAYNAADTLEECLSRTCALSYPGLEILVVDDGSTDDTAAIARRHPTARLVSIPHGGLSVARNAGFDAARGEVVAYLDADAYPSPDWAYYLALGLDDAALAGVGGPNVPPVDDPPAAYRVTCAPGGPLHVLMTDDRAEHIPGCNMAFRKDVLVELGGFDPVYTSAGDDVDLCWRVLDRGWEIGFHPAALVWHHRRAGLRAYLRQQRGYGRSEALVEARHPNRFTRAGSARWRGFIYDSFPVRIAGQPVYRGLYGSAAYQSVYRGGGYAVDLAHQLGIPIAVAALVTAPAGLLSPWLSIPAIVALGWIVGLAILDVVRARPRRTLRESGFVFRAGVATMYLLQPLVRTFGRVRHRSRAYHGLPVSRQIPGPARDVGRGVLLVPNVAGRAEVAEAIIARLRRVGRRLVPPTGWEDYDVRMLGSSLVRGDVITSAHPVGSVQVRVRRRPRWSWAGLYVACAAVAAAVDVRLSAAVVGLALIDTCFGVWRTGPGIRRAVRDAAGAPGGRP